MGEKSLLSSTSPGPSVVEPTRKDHLGPEGPPKPEGEGLEHLRGKSHWQREEGCPVQGGLSQTEFVRLKSWKEREDRGSKHQWDLLRALGEQSDS